VGDAINLGFFVSDRNDLSSVSLEGRWLSLVNVLILMMLGAGENRPFRQIAHATAFPNGERH
jgi:hypothetical protein